DFSWRSSARKYTWNRRSPSSSSSFASSAAKAASATSYASSTVCGTIVIAVCSRSQGQSRRSRSVSSWSSSSASASATLTVRGRVRRRRERRTGIRGRLVTGLILDLAALAVCLRDLRDPVGHLLIAVLLLELGADRLCDLRLRRRLDVADELDHEPAVLLGVDGFEERAGLCVGEDGSIELGHVLALLRRVLAADVLRAGILRVLLRQLGDVRAALDLRVDRVRERLLVLADEDLLDVARRRVLVLVGDVV